MENTFTSYLNSPLGWLKITSDHSKLLSISFEEEAGQVSDFIPDILKNTLVQLEEYFNGERKDFDLPTAAYGTEFQQQIWELVCSVNYGETTSYLEIAIKSGSSKNTRAVGMANGKNPIPIVIPCHRIVGSNGKLTGYAGGVERKRWLLLHEQKHSDNSLLF